MKNLLRIYDGPKAWSQSTSQAEQLADEFAAWLQLQSRLSSVAQHFGDATYGLYLLHPVIFFGLTFAVFPRLGVASPEQWPLAGRLLLGVVVLLSAFGLALLSEKYFERPLRDWSKRRG